MTGGLTRLGAEAVSGTDCSFSEDICAPDIVIQKSTVC